MDGHVRQVVGALLDQAGPGGAHQRTLLLVSGDHGQTLGGDHGGGSPEVRLHVEGAQSVGGSAHLCVCHAPATRSSSTHHHYF